jgi:hypothetical protein
MYRNQVSSFENSRYGKKREGEKVRIRDVAEPGKVFSKMVICVKQKEGEKVLTRDIPD